MSWRIRYTATGGLTTSADGTITTQDRRVLVPRGWLDVLPAPELPNITVRVRVRVGTDDASHTALYAEDVRIDDRSYPSIHRLALAEGAGWITHLSSAIPAALVRNAVLAPAPDGVSRRAVRSTDAPTAGPQPTAPRAPRRDTVPAPAGPTRARPLTASQSRRVLVVEDDDAVRDALHEALAVEGHDVIAVPHAGAALAYLSTSRGVELIVLDLMMPEMDGWTFLARRQREPTLAAIPVVVLTAHYGPARVVRDAGVAAILPKPFDPADVLGAINRFAAL